MSEDSVVDGTGDPPTANNIRMTWQRLCRDVAAEAAAAKPKRVPPSRISPTWRPTVVPPPPTQEAAAVLGAVVPASRQSLVDPSLPPEARAEFEKLDRIFTKIESTRLKV
jgi:hypothetical protein